MRRTLLGALSGFVATGPMTVGMILLHRRLPGSQKYPLPPREITMRLAQQAGVSNQMGNEARSGATLLSHFAYGTVAAAIYGWTIDPRTKPTGKGLLLGGALWSASYLGWLPALRILKPATQHPWQRTVLMLGVHAIWGLSASHFASLLEEEWTDSSETPFSPRNSEGIGKD